MVLHFHSDTSYLNAPQAHSQVGGHFFLSTHPNKHAPILNNAPVLTVSTILQHVAASAAETELGGRFINGHKAQQKVHILEALGHAQLPMPS